MFRLITVCIALFFTVNISAQTWKYSTVINVSAPATDGVFHHLESSGRQNIAVSGKVVGVVWEDDSDEAPRIYFSRKSLDSSTFSEKVRISAKGDAYEPSIISLGDGRFAIAWEEGEQIASRIVTPDNIGPVLHISEKASGQVNLAKLDNRILLVHRQQIQRFGQIILHELTIDERLLLSPVKKCHVDSEPLKNDQLYPVVAILGERVNVAWEDRRLGHTVIMHSQNKPDDLCNFSSPIRISEEPTGPKAEFGSGHGVARVALARYGKSDLYAAWADKRDFQEGYDIYGSNKNSHNPFGNNVRIQDDFGANYQQWHVTVFGHQHGQLVAAWTDDRDGSMDIWHSWLEDGDWSDDALVPGASGKGVQYHPSITLDSSGGLHIAWVHRETDGGPTQIRYISATLESQ